MFVAEKVLLLLVICLTVQGRIDFFADDTTGNVCINIQMDGWFGIAHKTPGSRSEYYIG